MRKKSGVVGNIQNYTDWVTREIFNEALNRESTDKAAKRVIDALKYQYYH